MLDLFMVFDVESIGLFGEGFAAGYVVIDRAGAELESGFYACDPRAARGAGFDLDWVQANVVPALRDEDHRQAATHGFPYDVASPAAVRALFWSRWVEWQKKGAVLVADCPWPVEANFLLECVRDDYNRRANFLPYPLLDVASFRAAVGLDPLATVARLDNELPVHHPLADARQSARLLREAFATVDDARRRTAGGGGTFADGLRLGQQDVADPAVPTGLHQEPAEEGPDNPTGKSTPEGLLDQGD